MQDENDAFDEVPEDAWNRLAGVPVTADILRQIHTRAKPITFAKPVRAVDSLSDMSAFQPQEPAGASGGGGVGDSSLQAAPRRKRSNRKKTKSARAEKVRVKVVTAGTMNINDRFSRVRIEDDNGEDSTAYD